MAHLVRTKGLASLASDPFVDFTVRCNDKTWQVHRTTLCGDSTVLMLHCTQMIEAQKRELDLREADPKAVECLLTYQYLGEYEEIDANISKQPSVTDVPDEEDTTAAAATTTAATTTIPASPSDDLVYVDLYPPQSTSPWSSPWSWPPPPSPPPRSPSPRQRSRKTSTSKWTPSTSPGTTLPHPQHTLLATLPTSTLTTLIILNISVFELAQRLSIPNLEAYAIKKFFSYDEFFGQCELDKVLESVFEVTATDDEALRYKFFKRVVENYAYVQTLPLAVSVLENNEPLAWHVATTSQTKIEDLESDLDRKRKDHKSDRKKMEKSHRREVRELKAEVRGKEWRIEDLQREVEDLARKYERERRKRGKGG